jgi:hypothetical protein
MDPTDPDPQHGCKPSPQKLIRIPYVMKLIGHGTGGPNGCLAVGSGRERTRGNLPVAQPLHRHSQHPGIQYVNQII